MIEEMDQPLLFAELMEPSWRLEDRVYRELLRRSNKAVLEEIRRKEDEQREYKEFIESWVHEAKNPITAMELLCENMEMNGNSRRSAGCVWNCPRWRAGG